MMMFNLMFNQLTLVMTHERMLRFTTHYKYTIQERLASYY